MAFLDFSFTNRKTKENEAITAANKGFKDSTTQSQQKGLDPSRVNYQTYSYDYYTGSQVKVFFGDIWVDDIISIQYNLTQGKTPLYGYASQHYDAVAKGTIIVNGQITIAFKEVGYLNVIQATLDAQNKASEQALMNSIANSRSDSNKNQSSMKFVPGISLYSNDTINNQSAVVYSPTGSPDIIKQKQTIEQILNSKKSGNPFSAKVGAELGIEASDQDFEDFAELLEDTIWGDSNGKPYKTKNRIRHADEFDYKSNGGILIGRDHQYAKTLNIMLAFGDLDDYRAEHTINVLNDCHFVSQGIIVTPGGEPIAETYSFFARDINRTISSKIFNIPTQKFEFDTPSHIKEIESLRDFISSSSNNSTIRFEFRKEFTDASGWLDSALGSFIASKPFSFNDNIDFNDQFYTFIENEIRDYLINNVTGETRIRPKQITISVSIGDQDIPDNSGNSNSSSSKSYVEVGNVDNNGSIINRTTPNIDVKGKALNDALKRRDKSRTIIAVVEQVFPESSVYRLISPTKNQYLSSSVLSREEIFKNVQTPKDIENDLDSKYTDKDMAINKSNLAGREVVAKVVDVDDADTFSVIIDGNKTIIRLVDIDAIEKKQGSLGPVSVRFAKDTLLGKEVTLKIEGTEAYGRVLATAKLGDKSYSEMVLEKGFAYSRNDSTKEAEARARLKGMGIWSGAEEYQDPSSYRDLVKRGLIKESTKEQINEENTNYISQIPNQNNTTPRVDFRNENQKFKEYQATKSTLDPKLSSFYDRNISQVDLKKLAELVGKYEGSNVKGSLAERNNNPGNMIYLPSHDRFGATKDPETRFAKFPTKELGLQASINDFAIKSKKDGGAWTVGYSLFVRTPPSDNNDTKKYITDIARDYLAWESSGGNQTQSRPNTKTPKRTDRTTLERFKDTGKLIVTTESQILFNGIWRKVGGDQILSKYIGQTVEQVGLSVRNATPQINKEFQKMNRDIVNETAVNINKIIEDDLNEKTKSLGIKTQ